MLFKIISWITVLILFVSCSSDKRTIMEDAALTLHADSIAQAVQMELISNVTRAIEKGGTAYAIDYCNTAAMSLTDSMSKAYGVQIQRITEKNRNLANVLKTSNDRTLYKMFDGQARLKDTLLYEGGKAIYYKRIHTAIPTCLGCHGDPKKDIHPETLRKIQLFYPNDSATGYSLNAFRAMWKITFPKD